MNYSSQQKSNTEILSDVMEKMEGFLKTNKVYNLTEKAGVSRQIIQELRNGNKTNLSLSTLVSICNAIGFKVDKIIISKIKKELDSEEETK